MRTKAEMLSAVAGMLKEAFVAKAEGAAQPRLARAYGYADGYLKALLDAGLATQKELLALVSEVRTARPRKRVAQVRRLPLSYARPRVPENCPNWPDGDEVCRSPDAVGLSRQERGVVRHVHERAEELEARGDVGHVEPGDFGRAHRLDAERGRR
jgi:hypothetical protein